MHIKAKAHQKQKRKKKEMKDKGKLTRYKANINNDITIYEYKLNAYNKYTLSNSYIISLDLTLAHLYLQNNCIM